MQTSGYLSEKLKIAGLLTPATVNSTPAYSTTIDMTKWSSIMVLAALGNMAAETIDISIQSDTVSTFDDDLQTVVAATQLAAHASNNDSKQVLLEAYAAAIPEGHRYARVKVVTGDTTGGPVAAVVLGLPHYSNEAQPATIVETKRV
jgi:hypothetical protein